MFCVFERKLDQRALGLLDGVADRHTQLVAVGRDRGDGRAAKAGRELRRLQRSLAGQNHAALEDIAELANVTRPGVRAEPVQHLGRDICHLGGVFAIQVLEQRLGKDGQIVLALPQGGQGNGKDVEAVEQVFPELAFADCIIER